MKGPAGVNGVNDESAAELTAALARNVDGAFEGLVLAYQHRVYGFGLRLCNSPRDAEEIAQDTFVRAYRALGSYPPERIRTLALRAWLLQIALNVWRNRVRQRQLPTLSLDIDERNDASEQRHIEAEDDPISRPEAMAEQREREHQLAARLAALPERYRVAVVLRHVEGFAYGEIAQLLDQPTGTVKANVHRGVRMLRAALVGVSEGA
jgi:RNA polymerase sigma-70 factor (ECF subfamily)